MTLAESTQPRMSGFDANLATLGPESLTIDHRHFLAYGRVVDSEGLQYICTAADHHGVWLVNRDRQTAEEIGPDTQLRCEPLQRVQLADLLQRTAKVNVYGQGEVPELCRVALERHIATGLIVPEELGHQLRLANKTSVVRAENKFEAMVASLAELVNDILRKRRELMA